MRSSSKERVKNPSWVLRRVRVVQVLFSRGETYILYAIAQYSYRMSKRLEIKEHLSYEELTRRYRSCKDGKEKARWQVIWLYSDSETSRSAAEVARLTGFSVIWVRALIHRYNAQGAAGMKRSGVADKDTRLVLSEAQRQALSEQLQGSAPDGGLWSSRKVAQWIKGHTGQEVNASTGWRYLQRLGFSPQVPRPRHQDAASAEVQAEFKKSSLNG